jgi:putative oxidoreductase
MEHYGPAVLRLVVGATFAAHGAQKLFGIWGGAGLAATGAYFDSIGLSPGSPLAVAVGLTETLGGLLLTLGALTPYAAAALIVTMLGAIWNVHLANGFFMNWAMTPGKGHGIEYNLVLIAALVCLIITGPGGLSFAHRRSRGEEADRAGRERLRRKYS